MNFRIGFSPCPNDTFIFYALLHGKIGTDGLYFSPVIEDVETLNRSAIEGSIDITKISFAAFLQVQDRYRLSESGSALGRNCGPLLISKKRIAPGEVIHSSLAIPGKNTTANFLFDAFFPNHTRKKELIFSEIEDAVLRGETDLGVIIHENRFTYEKKGLQKVADLGECWEQSTGHPIPLGGIAISRTMDNRLAESISRLIGESVKYAFLHPDEVIPFVRKYSQEMDEEVMWQHIHLYVNEYTVALGKEGRLAIETFFNYAIKQHIIDRKIDPLYAIQPSLSDLA